MIALAGNEVVERWRITLADATMPVQPYHAAESRPYSQAERLIQRAEETSRRLAREELERLSAHRVRAACVLDSSARELPDLKSVLASHALIHTAEGELYREALRRACAHLEIPLVRAREKDVMARIPPDIQQRIEGYAKILGPPWRQDEKLAMAAAWVAQDGGPSRTPR
jgi:hypothetical protein